MNISLRVLHAKRSFGAVIAMLGAALAAPMASAGGYDPNSAYRGYYSHKIGKPSTLSFDGMAEAVRNPELGIHSVEDLLAWVKKHHPDFLTRFTLFRDSRSAQGASPQAPRAIVFSSDAKFIFTFNGDPSHKGYRSIEAIQFRDPDPATGKGASFEFREITFSADGKRPGHVSAPNPASCMQCHQDSLRPIWDPYETWDGAYGKFDDALTDYTAKPHQSTPAPLPPNFFEEMRRDLADYRDFLSAKDEHSRYSLLHFRNESPVAPYAPGHRGGDLGYEYRPNLLLTGLLIRNHAKWLVSRMVADTARLAPFVAKLAEDLSGCKGSQLDPPPRGILRELGIELEDWSPAERTTPDWRYFEGADYLKELVGQELLAWLARQVPGFRAAPEPVDPSKLPTVSEEQLPLLSPDQRPEAIAARASFEAFCAQVRAVRLPEALARPAHGPAPGGRGVPRVVGMCSSCHGVDAPRIAALENGASTAERADWRQRILQRVDSQDPRKRMPPTRALNPRERRELEAFLLREN